MGMKTKIWNKFKNLKMGNKLISVFLVVIILPEIAISIFATYFSGYSIKNEVMKSAQETADQINDNIDNEMKSVMNLTTQIVSDQKVKTILDQERQNNLSQQIADKSYVEQLLSQSFSTVFSVEGVYLCSYNGEVYEADRNNLSLTEDYDFTRTSWFQDMKRRDINTMILSDYDSSALIEEGEVPKLFTIVKKVSDERADKEIGCMLIHMSCDMLGNLLQNVNNGGGQKVMMIDNNKRIIYHPDSDNIGTQFRSFYISNLLDLANGYMEDEEDGQFIAYSTSEVTGWVVIYLIEAADVMKNISRLKMVIFITTMICIILSFYFAFSVSRSISQPIAQLQKKMKQVGKGDFDIDVDVKTEDEIGHLSNSFDKMVKKTKQLIENVYQSEIYQKEAELNALQAQINPHFLYNTLQTIDMMAEEEGVDDISDACQALSKIFRYSINRGQEYVHLKDEITHIKNYMLIQKLRFGKKVAVEYEIENECDELFIVKLIIQPLVENAVLHGIENSIGMCTIKVKAYCQEELLFVEVWDDGDGIKEELLEELNSSLQTLSPDKIVHQVGYSGTHGSIGLKNTNARIKLYFGNEYGITILSKEGQGTLVRLKLPVKKVWEV